MTLLNISSQFEYLDKYFADKTSMYRNAGWLISAFDAPIWEYQLGTKGVAIIDWNVTLEDGESLLSPKHKDLLEGLKQYLITSTKNASDMISETNAISSQRALFDYTGRIIDHLLLNSNYYQLATFGLEGLNENHLIAILQKAGKEDADNFFDWQPSVGSLCIKLIESLPRELLEEILNKHPAMRLVSSEQEDENSLGIAVSDIPYARAALYNQDLLHKFNKRWQIKVSSITEIIYAKTLFAKKRKRPPIATLSYGAESTGNRRECPAVRVTTGSTEQASTKQFSTFQMVLHRIGTLHETGVPAPAPDDINAILSCEADLAKPGRYRTLPSAIALGAVRDAIEFHLKNGEHLISSFCKLAIQSVRTGKSPRAFHGTALSKILRAQTIELGVTKASLMDSDEKRVREDYFSELRSNASLSELVRVYIGSVQIVVGAMMARRSGELIDLKCLTCLDSTEQWLLFLNRKSTTSTFGIRNIQARPIEPIAVEMIKSLIRMQKVLKRIGYIKEMTSLFAVPCSRGSRGFYSCTSENFNRSLDYFCDYFQTAKNNVGERYYIRQHQLRRFFAMLFYHSSSFGGLETLQWMLAHTNRRHVWNYITESMTGAELMSSKSQHVAEQMHHNGLESYENLKQFLRGRYGSDEFLLWDIDDLEDEITHLQKEGLVEIDPDFFEDENGEQMRVVVKIVEHAA